MRFWCLLVGHKPHLVPLDTRLVLHPMPSGSEVVERGSLVVKWHVKVAYRKGRHFLQSTTVVDELSAYRALGTVINDLGAKEEDVLRLSVTEFSEKTKPAHQLVEGED